MATKTICDHCGSDIEGPYTRITKEVVEVAEAGGLLVRQVATTEDWCLPCSGHQPPTEEGEIHVPLVQPVQGFPAEQPEGVNLQLES